MTSEGHTDTTLLCERLAWDSEFFGFPIARVHGDRLTAAGLAEVDSWVSSEGIRCVYLLLAADAVDSVADAQVTGYRFVDTRATLAVHTAAGISSPAEDSSIRPGVTEDIPALRQIAKSSHGGTRFYADTHFDRRSCDLLYQTWIQKSVQGQADAVWVALDGHKAVGYITCVLDAGNAGSIGLLAVSEAHRHGGTGQRLVKRALDWFGAAGVAEVSVVTQGGNRAGLSAYQKCGFSVRRLEYWFHKWYE